MSSIERLDPGDPRFDRRRLAGFLDGPKRLPNDWPGKKGRSKVRARVEPVTRRDFAHDFSAKTGALGLHRRGRPVAEEP